ncbi:hypothetical protein SAMD00023519_00545 [Listeria monocytogenes]|nr:hypothetical protein SAMD00023519_00545 [Listeria monocytogenes]
MKNGVFLFRFFAYFYTFNNVETASRCFACRIYRKRSVFRIRNTKKFAFWQAFTGNNTFSKGEFFYYA